MKIVVLGSNAFSGQDFIDLLLDDPTNEVIGVSRRPEKPAFMLRYRDGREPSAKWPLRYDLNSAAPTRAWFHQYLDSFRPDIIVNFAAQSEVAPSWETPEDWFQTNTVALARLVNHLRKQDYLKKWVQISSPEAYGSCSGVVTEDTPDNPSTPYAASKAAADMLLSVYHKQYGFPVVTVRSTNTYGARQQLFKIIPRTAIYLKQGRKIQLHGGGAAVKSYIHVRDVSKGTYLAMMHGRVGERYHISPEMGVSVATVVKLICDRMGMDFLNSIGLAPERPGQDAAYVIDSYKAREEFDWAPEIGLHEGIAEVVDWVNANWDAILGESHDYVHQP